MIEPTASDVEAARKLLFPRTDPTHPKVDGLPGADRCPHRLVGDGTPVDKFGSRDVGEWRATPYRHHLYVANDPSPNTYCICGNLAKHSVHTLCIFARETK